MVKDDESMRDDTSISPLVLRTNYHCSFLANTASRTERTEWEPEVMLILIDYFENLRKQKKEKNDSPCDERRETSGADADTEKGIREEI